MQIEVAVLQGAMAVEVEPCGKSMNPAVVPVDTKFNASKAFVLTIGLVVVPAVAGQVNVAVPLVPPAPVIMHVVEVATPQFNAVNVPAAGVVPPIAGGEARYVENPVPETVELADKVVNDPAAAAEPPIAGGLAR